MFAVALSMILVVSAVPKVSAVQTLHVPSQYPTIEAALNAAGPGDTIQVASGPPYRENLVVDKSVSLVGENPLNTIIDGSGTGYNTVRVTADNVRIENFTIKKGDAEGFASLYIQSSLDHVIRNNIIKDSYYGILVQNSNLSYFTNNVIKNNTYGVKIVYTLSSSTTRNKFYGNLIEKNTHGVWISGSRCQNNSFIHNNIINNTSSQVDVEGAPGNFWHNGAEGNYWSDYNVTGTDLDGDGIGDVNDCNIHACIPVNSVDFFPLVEQWSEKREYVSSWGGDKYHTTIYCNSTVASFTFTYSLAQISFNVTGPLHAVSYCNVTIDKSFLGGNFTVLVDRVSKNPTLVQNSTHTSLYFTVSNSVRKIQIRGTKVVGNTVPNANFSYYPSYPNEGQEVQFTDMSTDPDGTVVTWSWKLGDGNTSSSANPVHKYLIGSYGVTLTVTDNEGTISTMTKTLVITAFSPDHTLYYILVGIAAGALILGIAFFQFRKKKKISSLPKTGKIKK
jgi:nitrous oxidase accessory protein NosD